MTATIDTYPHKCMTLPVSQLPYLFPESVMRHSKKSIHSGLMELTMLSGTSKKWAHLQRIIETAMSVIAMSAVVILVIAMSAVAI